jgi:homocysteine S-methyltransferase
MSTNPILLLDGALGTVLEKAPYNILFNENTPLWSSHLLLTHPGVLQAVHGSYVDAGADIIQSTTYQASVERFARTLNPDSPDMDQTYSESEAARYCRSAIPLARAAFPLQSQLQNPRHNQSRLALSLGLYGATMSPITAEYTGLYPSHMDSVPALGAWHGKRLQIYADNAGTWSGVEYVAFETVLRCDEVLAIRNAMQQVLSVKGPGPEAKIWWISGIFQQVDGEDIRHWIEAALGTGNGWPQPWAVVVNCTRLENAERAVELMEAEVVKLKSSRRPWLVLYPDGTQVEVFDTRTKSWVGDSELVVKPWAERCWRVLEEIRRRGVWGGIVVGGCCRTGIEDIKALRGRIEQSGK